MADYYKNADHFPKEPVYDLSGIQYHVVTDLAAEPIDIPFFKAHAKIDFNTDDALIAEYIKAARQELEAYSQLSFGVKTMLLTARSIPKYYKLMYGPVNTINTTGYTNIGDIVKQGGNDVEIEYTTKELTNSTIKIAVARYAAGLYAIREHILTDDKGNPVNGQNIINEAKQMLQPIRNVIIL